MLGASTSSALASVWFDETIKIFLAIIKREFITWAYRFFGVCVHTLVFIYFNYAVGFASMIDIACKVFIPGNIEGFGVTDINEIAIIPSVCFIV